MFNVWGHLLSSMAEWGLVVARVGNHCIRVFNFYNFAQFRLALYFTGYNKVCMQNISVLVHVEVSVTGHDILTGN